MHRQLLGRVTALAVLALFGSGFILSMVLGYVATLNNVCIYEVATPIETAASPEYGLLFFQCQMSFSLEPVATFRYELISWELLALTTAALFAVALRALRRFNGMQARQTQVPPGNAERITADVAKGELSTITRFARVVAVAGILVVTLGVAPVAMWPATCQSAAGSVPSEQGDASLNWTPDERQPAVSLGCSVTNGGEPVATFRYALGTPGLIGATGLFLIVFGRRTLTLARKVGDQAPAGS